MRHTLTWVSFNWNIFNKWRSWDLSSSRLPSPLYDHNKIMATFLKADLISVHSGVNNKTKTALRCNKRTHLWRHIISARLNRLGIWQRKMEFKVVFFFFFIKVMGLLNCCFQGHEFNGWIVRFAAVALHWIMQYDVLYYYTTTYYTNPIKFS